MLKSTKKLISFILGAACAAFIFAVRPCEPDIKLYNASAAGFYGDLDNNGLSDKNDAKILQQYLLGKTPDIKNTKLYDTNNDGKINIFDLIMLKRHIININVHPETQPSVTTTAITTSTTSITTIDPAVSNMNDVFKLVNRERSAVGAAPLNLNSTLCKAAATRAEELAELFSHTRPDGSKCYTAIEELGMRYYYAGENIAAGSRTPSAVMNQWMNSTGHRENILNENFTDIGVAYIYIPNSEWGYYWVQLFANPR